MPVMTGGRAVGAIVGLALVQVAPPVPDFGWVDQAGKLTLTTALIVTVVVLWRALGRKDEVIARKDDALLDIQKAVAAALATNTEASRTITEAVKDMTESNRELREAVDRMTSARQVAEEQRRPGRG